MMQFKHSYPTLLFLLAFFSAPSLFGQCPAPTITVDPLPFCNFPLALKAEGGPYTAYRWDNLATTPQISVGANGTYTVTVTCADMSTATATTTLNFSPPTVRMAKSLIRPCLPGDPIHLQILTTNSIPGSTVFTVVSSNMDTIIFESGQVAGNNTMTLNLAPAGPITYSIIKAVSSTGCNYAIGTPKSTNILPVFETTEQFPTIAGDPFFCYGGSTQLTILAPDPTPTSYLWITPGFPQWTLPIYNVSVEANYLVNVNYGADCQILLQQYVEEIQPMPDIVGAPICSGSVTTLSTSQPYVSYEWSNGDTSPEIEVDQPGEYRVTITDSYGCTGFATQFVQQIQSPNLSINGPIVLCTGQNNATLIASASNIATFAWSTGASTANINITGPGEYTVTVTSNNGCTAETSQIVEQIITPVIALTSPVLICQGASAVLSPTINGTPDPAYQWSTGATTATITVSTGGVYRVSVSDVTLSCTASVFTLVTILPLPVPVITTSSPTICEGATMVLNPNLGAGNSFLWSTGATTGNLSTGTAGTYTVTVTAANGCTGTDSESVTVLPVPHPQITGPKSMCGKDSVFISTTEFQEISWSTGATTSGVWVKNAGNYNVVVTNSVGCTGSAVISIANTLPGTLAINGPITLCGADSVTLVATGPFINYSWSNGINNDSVLVNTAGTYNVIATDNLGCTATRSAVITNQGVFGTAVSFAPLCNSTVNLNAENGFAAYAWSSGSTTQTYQANAAGTYTVTVSNAAGCTSSATYDVTVLPEAPVPAVAGPLGICPENTGNLTVAGTYPAYAWSTGSTTATAIAPAPGIFTVTVTDDFGCTGTGIVTVGTFASPLPEIAGSQTVCNGQPSELSVSNTYTAFIWNTGASSASINVNAAGTYTVTVTNTNGCTSATSIDITSSDILSPNIAIAPYNCDGQLTIDAGAGYTTYLWSNGATTSNIAVDATGEYGITVTNDAGCIGTTTQLIESIPSTPPLSLQGATIFCSNASTILEASANFNTYVWSTGSNNISVEIATAGTYTVTATDTNGCTRTAELSVSTNTAPEPVIAANGFDCNGNLNLVAGGPYESYSWDGGAVTETLVIGQVGTYSVTVVDGNGCTGTNEITILSIPQRPQVSMTGPNRICTGTTSTFEATAGFPVYLWSNGETTASIDVTNAGVYTVTVTDQNTCTATAEQSLDLLVLPVPVVDQAPYNCDGLLTLSTAELNLFTYSWSNGTTTASTTVSTTDIYTVTVTDPDGCTGTAEATADVPQSPVTQIVITPLPNYIVQLEATTGFQSYAWSNGDQTAATVIMASGIYTVTVTDALGCTATASAEVLLAFQPLTVSSTPGELTCANGNDGEVELCINGGQAPYTATSVPSVPFQISASGNCDQVITFNGISAGDFNWTLMDANNVSTSGSYTFINPDPISGSSTVAGSTVTVTAAGGIPPYQYSLDGSTFQTSPVFTNLPNGAYQVVILDGRGCTFLTGTVIVFTVSTDNPAGDPKMQITPNPGDGNFWLTLENYQAEEVQLSIWDVAGRNIRQFTLQTGGSGISRHPIDLNEVSEGTYMIQVRTDKATKTIPVVLIR